MLSMIGTKCPERFWFGAKLTEFEFSVHPKLACLQMWSCNRSKLPYIVVFILSIIKASTNSFRNKTMRCKPGRAVELDLGPSIWNIETITICIHPAHLVVLPFPYENDIHRSQRFWHVFLKCLKSIITVISEPPLDGIPKILNKFNLFRVLVTLTNDRAWAADNFRQS